MQASSPTICSAGFVSILAMCWLGMGGALAPLLVSAEGAREQPLSVAGGGEQEGEQRAATASKYNLRLVFARADGPFVGDVAVMVESKNSATLLTATAEGPHFWARLPTGRYRVEATYRGVAKQATVTLEETGQRVLHFRW